jgi:hypothetical protein
MAERLDVGGVVDAEQLFLAGITEAEAREACASGGFGKLQARSNCEQALSPLRMLGRSDVLEKQVVVCEKSHGRG